MEASQHRLRARESLRGNWLTAVLVALVAGLLGGGISQNFNVNLNLDAEHMQLYQFAIPQNLEYLLTVVLGFTVVMLSLLAIALCVLDLILGGVMDLGSARYNLNLIDRREAEFADLFSQFPRFSQALVMNLLTKLFIFLWSLLLVIPGIVASYRYAMAPYILLEDPNCTGGEAIQRSKAMMQGHKGELFWLDLTFIGWEILCAFTFGIGNLFLNPYKAASRASFYRNLQNQGYTTVE